MAKQSAIDQFLNRLFPDKVIGIDIGSSSIKIVGLQKKRSNWEMRHFAVITIPPLGDTYDEDSVMPNRETLREKLVAAFSEAGLAEDKIPVVLGVGGRSVVIKRIYVDFADADEEEERTVLDSEAEQYIPYDLSECEIRYWPIDEDDMDPDKEPYLVIAAKKDLIAEYTSLAVEVGCRVECVDSGVLALANMFEANYPEVDGVVALINVGAASTNINIMIDGISFFNREILKGGKAISDSIQSKLGMGFDEAEAMKVGETIPDDLLEIIEEAGQEIVDAIQTSFDFFMSTHPDLTIRGIYLTGGTAHLRGLTELLEAQVGIEVELVDPFRSISIGTGVDLEAVEGLGHLCGVAVGLAVRTCGDWEEFSA